MSEQLISVLCELGYKLDRRSNYLQTAAIYRGGTDPTSVVIYPEDNLCIDFVLGEKFSIEGLIARTLKLENGEKVKEWLAHKNIVLTIPTEQIKPKLRMAKTYSKDILKDLAPIHDYWIGRGISLETLQAFRGGLTGTSGRLKHRYVFPIFDAKEDIVGFTGRDVLTYEGNTRPKWKHDGNKTEFKWPLFLNHKIIKQKREVILVESPGCVLSLWECGIKNVICIFGTELSLTVLNLLIKFDVNSIWISTNCDEVNKYGERPGQDAALKIKNKLNKYFDSHVAKIHFPPLKDWNEVLQQHGKESVIAEWSKLIQM